MELAIVFGLAAGITVLIAMFAVNSKPETQAQRRARLYREAAKWDREIHKRTDAGIKRHLNPNYKPRKYVPNKARIQRRMREMMEDEGYTPARR